jgi:beta-lactam-binding protein with PASTA domain
MKKIYKIALLTLLVLNTFIISAFFSHSLVLKGENVSIPDLLGMTLDQAAAELAAKKLFVVQNGVQLHEYLEQGKIIGQDPPANTKMKINETVKVIISAGKEKVSVPRLIGINLQDINNILVENDLRRGRISHVHTPKYAAGKVIAQYPLENEEVPIDTRVSLLISQGEKEQKYLMPDLIGKRASVIISSLKRMGFNVGDVRFQLYRGLESGIIIKQTPPQGFRIQKRNLITLEVSK